MIVPDSKTEPLGLEPSLISRFADCLQKNPERTAVVEPAVQSSLQRDCVWSYSDIASLSAKISREIQCILLETSSLLEDNGEEKRRRRPSTEGWNCEKAATANSVVIIGIYMPRSVEYIAALLAVMKVGAAFVPLDTSWPLARLQQVCSDCKPAVILARTELVKDLAPAQRNLSSRILRVPRMESFLACVEMEKWRDAGSWAKDAPASQMRQSFLYVMYTSGSTGRPKGVCGTELGLMQRLEWMEQTYPYGEDDVACFKTSISFIDHLTELLAPILCGVPVIIPPPQHLESNPSHLFSYLEAYKVTRLTAVPSLLQIMAIFFEQNKSSSLATTMKVLVSSGEALRWSLFQNIQSSLPKAVILNLYGSTEVSGDCTCFNVSEGSALRKSGSIGVDRYESGSLVPIGKAIEGSFVRILDDEMQPVPVGQEGELFIGGAGLAHSYLNKITETEEKFPLVDMTSETSNATPEAPANSIRNLKRMYRTGDLARELPDGNIALLGRSDFQVKIHGVRVELGEVESTLALHPAVLHAAVRAWPCEGNSPLIAAYVVLRRNLDETGGTQPSSDETKSSTISTEQEKALEADGEEEREMKGGASFDGGEEQRGKSFEKELRGWLGERLLKAMVPTRVVVLGESSWPWTSSGKVERASFQEPDWTLHQEASKGAQGVHATAGKQHQDLTETIQKVMGEVLGLPPLHPHTDFFTSGGSSVTAAQLAHDLGIGMDILYTNPTPSLLSAALLRHPTLSNTSRGALSLKRSRSQDDLEQISPGNVSRRMKRGKLSLSPLHDTEGAHNSNSKQDVRGANSDSDLQKKREENESSIRYAAKICVDHRVDDVVLAEDFCHGEGVAFTRANRTTSIGEMSKGKRQSERSVCVHSEGLDRLELAVAAGKYGGVRLDDGGAGSSGLQLRERWKARLGSCVDASPLVVCRGEAVRVYVGSHAHNFCCFDGSDGKLLWETNVGGRVEATAGITLDGMHVAVGCYDGNVYFLDAGTGEFVWDFPTGAEVKCQPVADTWYGLIWCGSHDHCLYALDVEKRGCRFKYNCGGSLFGAPAIHHARTRVCVATTKGEVLAFSCEAQGEFRLLWRLDIGSPIFGSVAVDQESGTAVICSVDGNVSAFDVEGRPIWKFMCSGPIFAGATLSNILPGQVVVCSRDGSAYGISLGEGSLLWKYATGSPITASAFAFGDAAHKRYTCVCTSSGGIHIIRMEAGEDRCGGESEGVEELVIDGVGELQLHGDVFSSPVVHGSDLFVGCRDDHLYCISWQRARRLRD